MGETLVLLRNSERSSYRRCRWKWEQSYKKRLEPKQRGKALTFGSMVHEALAGWYFPGRERGRHPAEAFIEIYDADAELHGGVGFEQYDDDDNKLDARELGWAMLTGYVEKWGDDSHLEVLQPEMGFRIDVYDKQGNYLVTLVGTSDGPVRNHSTGRINIFEHKTAKKLEDIRINSGYGEQGLTYWWGLTMWLRHLKELGPDELIDGVTFNVLRKGMPDERPVNEQGHALNKPKKDALVEACTELGLATKGTIETLTDRLVAAGQTLRDIELLGEPSARQPTPLFQRQELLLSEAELDQFAIRLRKEAYEMSLVRKGKLPIYKNPTKDCGWDCPFVNACEIHEMGGDYEGVLEFDFKAWNPYEEHELEAEHYG